MNIASCGLFFGHQIVFDANNDYIYQHLLNKKPFPCCFYAVKVTVPAVLTRSCCCYCDSVSSCPATSSAAEEKGQSRRLSGRDELSRGKPVFSNWHDEIVAGEEEEKENQNQSPDVGPVPAPATALQVASTKEMADEKGGGDLGNKGYFGVGSRIKCRYQGGQVEGEVAAFQNTSRLLVIRAPPTNGKASCSNVYLINADCVDKISVDDRTPGDLLKPIDFHKLGKRREKSIGSKQARIRALAADVSPAGRKLFLTITKTIDEVAWDDDVIVVLNEVRITAPYTVEEVKGDKDASVTHIRKIVEKFWKEQGPTA